jgi:hypothetical protein
VVLRCFSGIDLFHALRAPRTLREP